MRTNYIYKCTTLIIILSLIQIGLGNVYSQTINILSLNNSLIDYNNQPAMFNEIAKHMNKNARWHARTQLGRTLLYHYNDELSRELALSSNWNYIILQEQSSLPRLCPEILMESVKLWKRALLDKNNRNIPIIILPMNWAYSDDWSKFEQSSDQLKRSYLNVCREIPDIIVCPIGLAYKILYESKGEKECITLYTDNRHPTLKASYLAACMEYAIIFDENPLNITYVPDGLKTKDAHSMRELAAKALYEWNKELYLSR